MRIHSRRVRFAAFILLLFVIMKSLSACVDMVIIKKPSLVTGRLDIIAGVMHEPADTLDLLIVGDSEAYSSVSPMVLWKNNGIASYLISLPGQQISEAYEGLLDALDTHQPKMVLVETNMFFRAPSAAVDKAGLLYTTVNRIFPIIQFHDLWKQAGKIHTSPSVNSYKGFTIRNVVSAYKGDTNYMETNKLSTGISDHVRNYVQRMVDICKRKGITVVFYTAPSPVNCSQGRHDSVAAFVKGFGVEYLDLNYKISEIGISWQTDTRDQGDHLNFTGAVKTTRYLSGQLKAYHLPDHRNETTYQAWNDLEKKYSSETPAVP